MRCRLVQSALRGVPRRLTCLVVAWSLALGVTIGLNADEPSPGSASQNPVPEKPAWRPYSAGPLAAADYAAPVPVPLTQEDGAVIRGFTTTEFQTEFLYRFKLADGVYRLTATEFTFIAAAVPGQSWLAEPDNGRLLDHEQGHFDITELFVRRANREIAKVVRAGDLQGMGATEKEAQEKMREQARTTLQPFLEEWRVEQRRYDRETLHGNDSSAQQEWRRKLNAELAETASKPKPAAAPARNPKTRRKPRN